MWTIVIGRTCESQTGLLRQRWSVMQSAGICRIAQRAGTHQRPSHFSQTRPIAETLSSITGRGTLPIHTEPGLTATQQKILLGEWKCWRRNSAW